MPTSDVSLILEALEHQRTILSNIQVLLEMNTWTCGCGHTNGSALAVCSVCGRKPGARE
jgi:hypothetical protein